MRQVHPQDELAEIVVALRLGQSPPSGAVEACQRIASDERVAGRPLPGWMIEALEAIDGARLAHNYSQGASRVLAALTQ